MHVHPARCLQPRDKPTQSRLQQLPCCSGQALGRLTLVQGQARCHSYHFPQLHAALHVQFLPSHGWVIACKMRHVRACSHMFMLMLTQQGMLQVCAPEFFVESLPLLNGSPDVAMVSTSVATAQPASACHFMLALSSPRNSGSCMSGC